MGRIKPNAFRSKRFILKYIESIPNDDITAFFKGIYHGQCYAGNPKKKTPTRVSIVIPKEIAEDNLKFMNDWVLRIIAIKVNKGEE